MRRITNTCGPKCIYFSCNSDVDDLNKRCTCDKYDIFVCPEDLCKDYDDHYTPVHDDFPVFELDGKYYTPKTEAELTNLNAKHDEGKPQIHLVPPQIIWDIAEVRMYGNKKYGDPDNWKTVEKWRYVDALLRHLLLYLEDPDGIDRESGIKHYKHAACNMAFICEMEAKPEHD